MNDGASSLGTLYPAKTLLAFSQVSSSTLEPRCGLHVVKLLVGMGQSNRVGQCSRRFPCTAFGWAFRPQSCSWSTKTRCSCSTRRRTVPIHYMQGVRSWWLRAPVESVRFKPFLPERPLPYIFPIVYISEYRQPFQLESGKGVWVLATGGARLHTLLQCPLRFLCVLGQEYCPSAWNITIGNFIFSYPDSHADFKSPGVTSHLKKIMAARVDAMNGSSQVQWGACYRVLLSWWKTAGRYIYLSSWAGKVEHHGTDGHFNPLSTIPLGSFRG